MAATELLTALVDPEVRRSIQRALGLPTEPVAEALEKLAAAQARTDASVKQLAAEVKQLATAQAQTDATVRQLVAAQAQTEVKIKELTQAQLRTEKRLGGVVDTVGAMKGRLLEWAYRDRAASYFGMLLRKVKVVPLADVEDQLERALTAEERESVFALDLLVEGRLGDGREVWLAVEVSAVIDARDLARARARAALLRKLGKVVVPVVAGEGLARTVKPETARGVLILEDGTRQGWPEALAAALAA